MAKITIKVPNDKVPEILASFRMFYEQGRNETDADYSSRIVMECVKMIVKRKRMIEAKKSINGDL